jgi:hypothetical protein
MFCIDTFLVLTCYVFPNLSSYHLPIRSYWTAITKINYEFYYVGPAFFNFVDEIICSDSDPNQTTK